MRSVALTFRPLIFQKGKLRHRQTWQTCNGSHCMSVLEPGKELMNTAVNFLVLFLPRLGGMFTPCSLSSRLTGSLRISPGLPAPLPPFPQLAAHIFPEFSACFSSGAGVLPNASHSLGSGASHSQTKQMGEGKQKKKKKVQAHVDMHKTLSPSETLEPSPAPLANCRRRSADLALLAPAEESYCPSFLLPPTDTYVHPPRV